MTMKRLMKTALWILLGLSVPGMLAAQWTQQAELSAPMQLSDFGSAVSLSADGQTAAVGAPLDGTAYQGAVYVFQKTTNGSWSQVAKLRAVRNTPGNELGLSV